MAATVNLHNDPPFIECKGNIAVSRTGDVIFCYRMELPEKHSLSEKGYDDFVNTISRAFRGFESETVVHKLDYCAKRLYDGSHLPEKTWLQRSFKEHHQRKYHQAHECCLFFTWTLSDLINKDEFINPFKRLSNEKEIIKKLYENHFPDLVKNAVSYVNQTNKIQLQELDTADVERVCRSYFSALLQGVFTDVDGTKAKNRKEGLVIGQRYADIYTVHSQTQLPSSLTNINEDPELSEQERPFYQGVMEKFGVGLPYDHIVNQIIYLPPHNKIFGELQKVQNEFRSSRGFALNAVPAKKIHEYLEKVVDDKASRLVKAHFNIILITDSEQERQEARKATHALFTENDMVPYMPSGNALRGIFLNSFFAFSSKLPSRFKFTCDLKLACALFIPTAPYKDDPRGIYFCDRLFNIPLLVDIFGEDKKLIKAGNFFVVAPTGHGKSTTCNTICNQVLDLDNKLVINDRGKSYQNLFRLNKDRAVMMEFEPGQSLGINPFQADDLDEVDTEKVIDVNDIINLLHFKGRIVKDDIPPGHDTCIRKVVDAFYKNTDEWNMRTFYKFFEFIHKAKRYEEIGVDPEIYDPYEKMGEVIFSLSEYGTPEGIYSHLFETPKDDRKLIHIDEGVDFAYFEFDKAGKDPLYQSLLQLYSFQATRKLIWENKAVRGMQLYDEYGKQIKNPEVASTSEYIAQAIRKQFGLCGFVIQSVSQLPKTDTISSILDNTSVYYILPTDRTHQATAERLELPKYQRYLLDSIESDLSGEMPYTEIFLLRGKKAKVVRNQLPRKHILAFQTEGELYDRMNSAYQQMGDLSLVIEEMIKKENQLIA